MVRTSPPPDWWPNRDALRRAALPGLDWSLLDLGVGPVALLLHGTGAASHSWADLAPALTRAGFRVLAPDLPGHGGTVVADPPGDAACSLTGMAQAVAELLRAEGVTPAVVAGHSAGAAVALRLLADGAIRPDTPIVGLNAALVPPPPGWEAAGQPLFAPVVQSGPVAAVGAWLAQRTGLGRLMLGSTGSRIPDRIASGYEWCFAQPGHVHAALTMMARWTLPDLLETLRTRRDLHPLPLTLVHGDRDRWVPLAPLRRILARLPGTILRVHEGYGHVLHEEAPALAAQEILRALR